MEYLCFVAGCPLTLWYCTGKRVMKSVLPGSLHGNHRGDTHTHTHTHTHTRTHTHARAHHPPPHTHTKWNPCFQTAMKITQSVLKTVVAGVRRGELSHRRIQWSGISLYCSCLNWNMVLLIVLMEALPDVWPGTVYLNSGYIFWIEFIFCPLFKLNKKKMGMHEARLGLYDRPKRV